MKEKEDAQAGELGNLLGLKLGGACMQLLLRDMTPKEMWGMGRMAGLHDGHLHWFL